MGHVLHAVIGPKPAAVALVSRWLQASLIDLPQGFSLVPLAEALHDEILESASAGPDPFPEFERLSGGVAEALRRGSAAGPLGYVETDYFGGLGSQRAVAWSGGNLLAGPFKTVSTWNGSDYESSHEGELAINRILAAPGVRPRPGSDAFDTLGLGDFRETESAAEESD
jgi:hypothetical protein